VSKVLIVDLDDRDLEQLSGVDEEIELVKRTIDDHHDKLDLSSPLDRDP